MGSLEGGQFGFRLRVPVGGADSPGSSLRGLWAFGVHALLRDPFTPKLGDGRNLPGQTSPVYFIIKVQCVNFICICHNALTVLSLNPNAWI